MKRILVRVLVIAVLIGAGVGGYFLYVSATKPPELTFRTVKVEKSTISARISATGTLSAHVTVQVGSQVSGRVLEIGVDFNSPVKKGQRIARIDPQLYQAAVAQARANSYAAQGNLTKAKAQALDAERQLTRARSLRAEGLNSQVDVDTAETNAAVAQAQIDAVKGSVEQARAQQQQADVNLAYTDILSPIDGVVISRNVDVGQTVAASLQAPTLFTIAQDLRQMQVDTSVTEGDVGKLKAGMPATFVVDAYPNKRFKGTIRQIRNAPTSVQNVVTYDAVIDVDNPDLELKPGMTANVAVVWDERASALAVPNAALRFRPPAAIAGSASAAPASSWGGAAGAPGQHSGRRRSAASADAPTTLPASSAGPDLGAGPADSAAPASSAPPARTPDGGRGGPGGSGPPTDRKTVWVLRGPKPEVVRVRTGLTDGNVTEILEGDLHEGDLVITEALGGDDAPAPAASSRPGGGSPSGGGPRLRF